MTNIFLKSHLVNLFAHFLNYNLLICMIMRSLFNFSYMFFICCIHVSTPWHWQSAKVPCKEFIIKQYFARSKLFHLASVTRAIFLCPACSPGSFNTLTSAVVVHSTRTLMNKDAPHKSNANGEAQLVRMTRTNLRCCIHFSAAAL